MKSKTLPKEMRSAGLQGVRTMLFPFCALPFVNLRVNCEGEAYMCCLQREQGIGNILSSSWEDVWFGKLAEEIRAETNQGKLHAHCQGEGCPFHFSAELKPGVSRKTENPLQLEIDLPNTHCNIGGASPNEKTPACLMCERSVPGYPFQKVDRLPEVLAKLAPLMPRIRQLHIQGVAEAFWKDYLFKVLDLLGYDAWKDRIRVTTTTNGTLLDESRRRKFLERCPKSMVAFSLDAATSETYQKIRRLDVYDRVVRNLMAYSKERRKYPHAELTIQNNINTLNVSEVVGMVRVAAEAEVDRLIFSATLGYNRSIIVNRENAHLFREAQRSIEKEAKKLGVVTAFVQPLDLGLSR